MSPEKVLSVIASYREVFVSREISAVEWPHEKPLPVFDDTVALQHCHYMLARMETFVAEGRMEKVFRWLGFVQACLWMSQSFTLEELKDHSRPPE